MPEKAARDVARPLREQLEKGLAALHKNNLDYAVALLARLLEQEPGLYEARQALRAAQLKKVGGRGGFLRKMFGTASASPLLARGQLELRSNPLQAIQTAEQVLAGDAINTASRLQSVAPEMGVAVGISTFEATRVVFDYVELEPATLKGKAEPVRVFHAKSARARFGTDLTRTHDSPFVGREIDLTLLKGVFGKTVASNSVQLVTVVGEPGAGEESDRRRASRPCGFPAGACDLAAGAVPPIWGGDHVLGAGRDPEGPHRHPRQRPGSGGGGEAGRGAAGGR